MVVSRSQAPRVTAQEFDWCSPTTNDHRPTTYFKYFPNISCSFSFVAGGILAGSVRMACASADPHLQVRAFGIADTVAFTTLAAFAAFFTSTETICSTVTES